MSLPELMRLSLIFSMANKMATSGEISDRLHSASIRLLRWLRREDDRSGLSAPRLSALSVVVWAGPLTLGALATAEHVRPPTMTRLVQGLEAAGLVRRQTDPSDGRIAIITPTARGRRTLAAGRARRVRVLAERVEKLAAGERATLERAAAIIDRLAGARPANPERG